MSFYELLLEGPLLIAIISMLGLLITIIFNIKTSRENTKIRLTSLMNQLIQEHYSLYTKEPSLKEHNNILAHAQAYFDLMNRIAFLALKEKISEDVPKYLKGYYGYVQQWKEYYNDVLCKEFNIPAKAEEDWPHIKKWCVKKNIWYERHHLPYCNFLNPEMEEWRRQNILN